MNNDGTEWFKSHLLIDVAMDLSQSGSTESSIRLVRPYSGCYADLVWYVNTTSTASRTVTAKLLHLH